MTFKQFLCSLVGNSENTRWPSMSVVNTVLDAMLPAVWLVDPGFFSDWMSYFSSGSFLRVDLRNGF
jgi:hypothetical protein